MPLYHCSKCHHEWEWSAEKPCDWCGATSPRMLTRETSLEMALKWFDTYFGKRKESNDAERN
jgi:hypothetical protein